MKVVDLLNLRPLTLSRTPEGVADLSIFLKLSVLKLHFTVLLEAVKTQKVSVWAVEDKDNITAEERGRQGGRGMRGEVGGRMAVLREREKRKGVCYINNADMPFFFIYTWEEEEDKQEGRR